MNVDIFVVAAGKCGSSTLLNSFVQTFLKYKIVCIKAHNTECFLKQYGYNGFYKTINCSSKRSYRPLYIIDSYRTPIERKISGFFNNGETNIPNFNELNTTQLIEIFNKNYLFNEDYHTMNDIFKTYNIPQWTSFPHNKQLKIMRYKNIIFIKLLYKHIHKWEAQLKVIFGKRFKLHSANISSNKTYNEIYKKFLAEYKVPISYLQTILVNDKEFKLYNSPRDQQAYISMWTTKST